MFRRKEWHLKTGPQTRTSGAGTTLHISSYIKVLHSTENSIWKLKVSVDVESGILGVKPALGCLPGDSETDWLRTEKTAPNWQVKEEATNCELQEQVGSLPTVP